MATGKSGILNSVVRFSLRFRGIIIALAIIFLVYAVYSLAQTPYDVFPEFAPPQVVIQTEAPGFSPEQVEVLVTQPIENAINGISGVESIRSGSILGLSVITVTFHPGADIYRSRQAVAEPLATLAGQLPEGVGAPVITPLTSSTSVIMALGLTSEKRSLMEMRSIADWFLRPRLLAVPGVAKAVVFGGLVKQFQVQVSPQKLIQYNLSLEDILDAAGKATGVRGSGFVDTANQRISLQTEGQFPTPEQIAATRVVYQNGADVTLGEVAKIVEAPAPPNGAAQIMGKTGIMVMVSSQYQANALEVTSKVEQALEEITPALEAEGIKLHPDIFRAANFIEASVHNIKTSLIIGAILVVAVIFLFLFNFRSAAISSAAIPLSLLAGVAMIERLGLSLNTITLGGLAIAIGEVVDDAVIDVENILRRLRKNRLSEAPRPAFPVVLDASVEVRGAVIYATLAVALVFVPILTMSGTAGKIFAPLAISYISAVLASLVVALTLTPVLCLVFLGESNLKAQEPVFIEWLKKKYRATLALVENNSRKVVFSIALFTLACLACIPLLGGGFLPELKEGHFIVHMTMVPGTSLEETIRIGQKVTSELVKIPSVRMVAQRAGGAEEADDILGTHSSEFEVDLNPMNEKEAEALDLKLRDILAQFPGASFSMNTFLTERIEETLSGYTAPVVIHVVGNDLNELDRKARQIEGVLSKIRGVSEMQIQSPPGTPQLAVKLRSDELRRWGFQAVDVLDAIHTAYQGAIVGHVYDGNRVFAVSVILGPENRMSISEVAGLPLKNSEGTYVRLDQLADIYQTSGRYVVLHEHAHRVQTITCNVTGRDVNSFVAEAKQKIRESVSLPAGTYVQFAGAAEAQAKSRRDLLIHSLLAAVGIVLLLAMIMGGARNLALLLLNLPFALAGGVIAVLLTGGSLTLGSIVGFVTLFGITLRNSIMMISHFKHLVDFDGMEWGAEAALRGASERLVPILMTAAATALGLLPLAIGGEVAGREIEGPLAVVILGGLITSTILNLLVLPTLALHFGKFERKQANNEY